MYRKLGCALVMLAGLALGGPNVALAQDKPAAAAVSLPATPVGEKAGLYFDANNSLDPAKMKAFLTEHFPKGLSNPQFEEIQQSAQGIDILSVDEASDQRLLLTVRTRKSQMNYRMIFRMEAAEPSKLGAIGIGMF